MRKKDREQIDNLKKDIERLKDATSGGLDKLGKLGKLKIQIKCGMSFKKDKTQGHNFKFIEGGKYINTYNGFGPCPIWIKNNKSDIGKFACIYCNIEMTRKLTIKEKQAIKTIGKD
jgi:hypothetical protein